MNLDLTGKTAIVTGGSRGIGKAIARALAGEGVDVAIVARSAGPLEQAAAELAEETIAAGGGPLEQAAAELAEETIVAGGGIPGTIDY